MKKNTAVSNVLAMALLSTYAAQGAHIIYSDDFSSSTIQNNRFRVFLDEPNIWAIGGIARSDWVISGGTLNNPTTGPTDSVASEGAVLRLTPLSSADTSLNKIRVRFSYNIGASTTTFFHLWGLKTNGTPDVREQLANTEQGNGGIQNQAETDFADINILRGTDPNGFDGLALTGSGTYDMTFDLTTYAWSADEGTLSGVTIGNITAFDSLLYGWGNNITTTDGSGSVTIDNFILEAIPEPSSSAILCLGALGILLRRRR